MEAKTAWEPITQAGTDMVDSSDLDELVKLTPTYSEALQAALVFGRYIKEFDDPLLQKFEVMLDLVGKRTWVLEVKNMKDTKITSYFSSQ
jgi:hypothetical protein